MRVALLTDGLWPHTLGGMQKHSYYLIKNLASQGVEVDVFYTAEISTLESSENSSFLTQEESRRVNFYSVPLPVLRKFPGHYLVKSYVISKKLLELYSKSDRTHEIVYIQGFAGWAFMISKDNRIKSVSTILNFHGLEMFQLTSSVKAQIVNWVFRIFVKRNIRRARYSQSLGGELTNILRRILKDERKIIELGIGISSSWVRDLSDISVNSTRGFAFIGRCERRKGIEELNLVLRQILNEGNFNFNFEFIGPIPQEQRINHPRIIYHGEIKSELEIQSILMEMDILVCPSHSEGMPTVILEGMANGCAIIASDVGAVRSEVDMENGWLIQPLNVPKLKEAILDAAQMDGVRLLDKKRNSLEKVRQSFVWEKLIKRHIEMFNEVI